MAEITRMDVKEFREGGYLQELNRRFLHPLGLAIEVVREEDGSESLGGIWDYRSDPEGIFFEGVEGMAEKAAAIDAEWERRKSSRLEALGYMIQPLEVIPPVSPPQAELTSSPRARPALLLDGGGRRRDPLSRLRAPAPEGRSPFLGARDQVGDTHPSDHLAGAWGHRTTGV